MRFCVLICVASALAALIICNGLAEARASSRQEWQAYKQKFGKVYETPEEDARRFARFMLAKAEIAALQPNSSYKLGLNHLSDRTEDELTQIDDHRAASRARLTQENSPEGEEFLRAILDDPTPVPDSVDWRKVPNRVNPVVYNQGICNYNWAFASIGVLEGQQVVRNSSTKSLVPLSAQDVIDCTGGWSDCGNGNTHEALDKAAKLGGVMSLASYPYVGGHTKCKFSKNKAVIAPKSAIALPEMDEVKMKAVVAKYGPISAGADSNCFSHYKSGILDKKNCVFFLSSSLLIVGYGSDPTNGDYWIAKNSWGKDWGEQGYMRLRRGSNTAGIATFPVIAGF